MKALPVGIQEFSELRKDDNLYVDKTSFLYRLLQGPKYYFLARPRRFGKSLLISKLYHIFKGDKHLFEGLWIEDQLDWEAYRAPVIRVDFNTMEFKEVGLATALDRTLDEIAQAYQITLVSDNFRGKFSELIDTLYQQQGRVVLLIDEYDKAITSFLDKNQEAIAHENRDILKSFYGVIKPKDAQLRFVLLTGVSKFGKVSIFSDLNNLYDLSTDPAYTTMLGYTQEELENYFAVHIQHLQTHKGLASGQLLQDIQQWYNGYSWDGENFLYNPFSVLSFFQKQMFSNFWFETGTPTFLLNILRKQQVSALEFEQIEVFPEVLDNLSLEDTDIYGLLLQTGYLTIKAIKYYSYADYTYILDFPNKEVKQSFLRYHLADYMGIGPGQLASRGILQIHRALQEKDTERFIEVLRSVFKSIPYNLFINLEAYYHSIIYLVLELLGFAVQSEVQTNDGRVDAVIQTDQYIYVMEFKLHSAEEAIAQIHQKKYYQRYQGSDKEILLLGLAFDTEEKNVGEWKLEKLGARS